MFYMYVKLTGKANIWLTEVLGNFYYPFNVLKTS